MWGGKVAHEMKTVRESDFPEDGFDHAQICPNGHVITSSFYTSPEFGEEFCAECSKPTFSVCPSCSSPIRGSYKSNGGRYRRPPYCYRCGAPFPWTARAFEEWRLLMDMAEGLKDADRERLKSSIDDIAE